ncbi:DgyrCDS8712 [Dimorphilus gyrociliatus]|uniref:DgyrCDS8712 n=1 Tax=Dimorphilus gyrociliatus TaxID=2664684 RepID=A0A7I8VXB2_9ANNE|nr:DgyrCDS8712 [Dimorphilus gyrociliatus]
MASNGKERKKTKKKKVAFEVTKDEEIRDERPRKKSVNTSHGLDKKRGIKKLHRHLTTDPKDVDYSLSVCFQCNAGQFTHADVYKMAKERLDRTNSDPKKMKIIYEPRNVILGSKDHDDRWIVTASDIMMKRHFMRGFLWKDQPVFVRKYQEILEEEWKACKKMHLSSKIIKSVVLKTELTLHQDD